MHGSMPVSGTLALDSCESALFHVCRGLRFHNAIWHGFVLIAASCHYSAVLACLFWA
jgi:predicted membrane channel-forming protein YqfA (hemolysin III family)